MTESGASSPTPIWLTIAIGVMVPVVISILTMKMNEFSVKKDYIQIAAEIAQNKDAPPPLKEWAVDLLNEMSPVPFSNKVKDSLAVYPTMSNPYKNSILFLEQFWMQDL